VKGLLGKGFARLEQYGAIWFDLAPEKRKKISAKVKQQRHS
jgi:hypothetical protein